MTYWKFFYELSPIDNFAGTMTIEEYIKSLQDEVELMSINQSISPFFIQDQLIKIAKGLCLIENTIGTCELEDIHTVRIGTLPFPDENMMKIYIVCKQSNNGTTFVASPIQMPWLVKPY